MADTRAGSEDLVLANDAHNYLIDNRIASVGSGFQTIYVSDIVDQSGVSRAKPWGHIYLSVLEDIGPGNDPLNTSDPQPDLNDVEMMELDFT